ncbi:oxidative stress-induced growth inhibitor 2 [Lingula anatina]|uniref:Oxidative stress-induced growth inhibitor 2 n=1 Tax=Lingula anatina TaxID=7574 RepID=A0A1S3IDD5_LINAN|nr:oxidative stress-induced growth inhibitor 2 [Lingula anatina]|eukprot:XP_013395871.1 oxidative stress-induced growth inhibitor 2 [Lingula anatina]
MTMARRLISDVTSARTHSHSLTLKSEMKTTEVIIIGNGPSGITLSYMLSGHWPYYNGQPLPPGQSSEYLQMRLEDKRDASLVEQELESLSDGIEGRSTNPVAVLLDSLNHPGADTGLNNTSVLKWQLHKNRHIPHVVLGKTLPGGAWQMMEGNMQTLSLGNWMELPGKPFREWLKKHRAAKTNEENGISDYPTDRASMTDLRDYYQDYVHSNGLTDHFQSHSTVTSVRKVVDTETVVNMENGEVEELMTTDAEGNKAPLWEVRGFHFKEEDDNENVEIEEFCYRAPHVVLATGSYDLPNRLHVEGEQYPFVLHSLPELEERLNAGDIGPDSDPVMIVGSGLTAADAILCCMNASIPIVHVFRRQPDDPSVIYNSLPPKLYPEYHKILQMMKGEKKDYECYKPYAEYSILQFGVDNQVLIKGTKHKCTPMIKVSYAVVLIGSKPDLTYLPNSGRDLGVVPNCCIDCKHNPLDLDPYTFQSNCETGLFAMGPLSGDNFVRFIQGGALGITNFLWKKRTESL